MLPQIQILELHGVVVESDGAFVKERANEKCFYTLGTAKLVEIIDRMCSDE